MADIFTKQKRSEIMSKIGSKDTAPELAVRSALHKMGFRYRLHSSNLPGKPDIVLKKYKTAIFIHGCFWHGHSCYKGQRPASNKSFWNEKLDKNIARDKIVKKSLKKEGWKVYVIWGCSISKGLEKVLRGLSKCR